MVKQPSAGLCCLQAHVQYAAGFFGVSEGLFICTSSPLIPIYHHIMYLYYLALVNFLVIWCWIVLMYMRHALSERACQVVCGHIEWADCGKEIYIWNVYDHVWKALHLKWKFLTHAVIHFKCIIPCKAFLHFKCYFYSLCDLYLKCQSSWVSRFHLKYLFSYNPNLHSACHLKCLDIWVFAKYLKCLAPT